MRRGTFFLQTGHIAAHTLALIRLVTAKLTQGGLLCLALHTLLGQGTHARQCLFCLRAQFLGALCQEQRLCLAFLVLARKLRDLFLHREPGTALIRLPRLQLGDGFFDTLDFLGVSHHGKLLIANAVRKFLAFLRQLLAAAIQRSKFLFHRILLR